MEKDLQWWDMEKPKYGSCTWLTAIFSSELRKNRNRKVQTHVHDYHSYTLVFTLRYYNKNGNNMVHNIGAKTSIAWYIYITRCHHELHPQQKNSVYHHLHLLQKHSAVYKRHKANTHRNTSQYCSKPKPVIKLHTYIDSKYWQKWLHPSRSSWENGLMCVCVCVNCHGKECERHSICSHLSLNLC